MDEEQNRIMLIGARQLGRTAFYTMLCEVAERLCVTVPELMARLRTRPEVKPASWPEFELVAMEAERKGWVSPKTDDVPEVWRDRRSNRRSGVAKARRAAARRRR